MWIVGILLAFVVLSSWILPWINRNKIVDLRNEVEYLRSLIHVGDVVAEKPIPEACPEVQTPIVIKPTVASEYLKKFEPIKNKPGKTV